MIFSIQNPRIDLAGLDIGLNTPKIVNVSSSVNNINLSESQHGTIFVQRNTLNIHLPSLSEEKGIVLWVNHDINDNNGIVKLIHNGTVLTDKFGNFSVFKNGIIEVIWNGNNWIIRGDLEKK